VPFGSRPSSWMEEADHQHALPDRLRRSGMDEAAGRPEMLMRLRG
jgi:hypothetical protein